MSLICSSKTACKAKNHKMKIIFPTTSREEAPGTTTSLREEGAHISENWIIN
jgi:hypothetical protein